MKYLKNERAWKRWASHVNQYQLQSPIDPPTGYPCFGYLVVKSYGYEEERAVYLYAEDIEEMRKQME